MPPLPNNPQGQGQGQGPPVRGIRIPSMNRMMGPRNPESRGGWSRNGMLPFFRGFLGPYCQR
jgi:hypothetical protein